MIKYFAIGFPNHTTFIVKTEKLLTVLNVIGVLHTSKGLYGSGDSIFNPRQFISINPITSPDERQKRVAKDLDKVLF